ncbi:PHP domain-containing protein [Paenibacillus sp. LHD-117]|uniref:PHP domain-containing protein n=1 Tax=Paenibacillus sp. LHD-117 TaxID=3071412 RepID=UPI0027DF285E|nr:PHP domain-containing protein [Paenibacillus sp. LHD-117]MDQ6420843.1 PHP domain-containing protein [Paenibacillus sp. LHD-117]
MALATDGRADLHAHTTASDGMYAPAEVVRKAFAAGLQAVAITDHDTVTGVEEALREGERIGMTVVPGVEISSYADGTDIHVLGYYTDNADGLWQQRLESLRGVRANRNTLIVHKLQSLGIPIEWEDVLAVASAKQTEAGGKGKSIGRPHIAEALIRQGVVTTMAEAFDKYLASGAAAYVELPRVHPAEAIGWIKDAGGVSVIAHPGLYGKDGLVEELIRSGADGIEVYHPDHGFAEEERYNEIARRHGIVATGGSDYHGERQGVGYHGELGSRTVPASAVLDLMRSRRNA